MPTYEYRCKSCGRDLEVVQSFQDPSLTECPECGGPLRKLFGSIGITFKGDGFYKNDSRSGSKKSSTESSGSDHSPSHAHDGHSHSHGDHSHTHSSAPPTAGTSSDSKSSSSTPSTPSTSSTSSTSS